jgi:methyl-accepting chemotaxis protein
MLSEDWVTLESFVDDASKRRAFSYLVVSDHQGTIRSATDKTQVGQNWQLDNTADQIDQQEDVVVTTWNTDEGKVFNFNLPVLFGDTDVGEINLGVRANQLDATLATTQRMIVIFAFAIVLAFSFVIYIFNKLIAKNVSLATQALKLFTGGHLETRISKTRGDEFGDLFNAFNKMADSLEHKVNYDTDEANQSKDSSSGDYPDPDASGITMVMGIIDEETIANALNKDKDKDNDL